MTTTKEKRDTKHIPNFFAKSLFNEINDSVVWEQNTITMYGKTHNVPRLTSWYGISDYSYSGIKNKPNQWTKELLKIKSIVEKESNTKFNSLLINKYRDGNDSVNWHSDDEKELGNNPIIASVSFGTSRDFLMKNKITKELISVNLSDGDIFIMGKDFQKNWIHSIPKRKRITESRINLTFRKIITP